MLEGPKGFSGLLLQLEAESQHNPNDIELMQRLGRLYFRNNSIEEATRVFRQILQLDENNLSALVELSLCLSKVGNFDEAEFNLERAQEIRPGFHTLYLAFSKLHEAKGNAELQVSYMMRAANAAPEKLDIRLALADLLKKYGDLSGAIFQYKLILEKNPNFEAALFALGTILMKRNEVSPAIGYFQRVIEFNPGAFDAHFNLGSCFFRQKKYSYALRNLQFAVRAQGLQKKSLYLISQSYTKLGDFDRAIVTMEKLADSDETNISYQKCLAELYEQTKEYDLARDCYRRLAANFPERPEFMVKHAMMLIKLKDFSAAEKSLDTLFRFHPGHIDGHRILGEMYCSTGRFKLAIEEFKRTLLINEDFIPGILGLAAVYKETENHEQEYETLKIAVEKGRETAEIIFRLGEIERKLKMPASMDRFKRVRELAPETSYAQEAEYYIRHQAA